MKQGLLGFGQRHLLLAAVIGASVMSAESNIAQAADTVTLHSGNISGELLDADAGVQVFRGIPYAAPPVGDLRWTYPRDVAPWDGVKVCKDFGSVAPQNFGLTNLVGDPLPDMSEDCLFLNVWSTGVGETADRPVMVWIHGGGFNVGWSQQSAYEGSEFAKRGIVLVTINYRIGPLGFLSHPALSAESEHNSSGNYGLMDCVFALEWVKKNIDKFGGDSGNVTIFGESAGGSIVGALCASPLAKGLFQRGIAQSPGISDGQYANLDKENKHTSSAHVIGERWASGFVDAGTEDVLATLRAIPAMDTIKRGISGKVVIDDWFMDGDALEIFAAGEQHDVSLMVGTNADEGTIFLGSYPWRTVEAYEEGMRGQFWPNTQKILDTYVVETDEDIPIVINKFISDTWFLRGGVEMLKGMEKVSSSAYQYVFTQESSRVPDNGAFHSAEMCYVFKTVHPHEERADNPELSDAMIDYWVAFAKTGNPNVEGLPSWPKYDNTTKRYLELGEVIQTGTAYREEYLDVLNSVR